MNWELKGREVKHTKDLPEGTIGFVYIIHLSNGKKYIGRKSLYSFTKRNFGKKEIAAMADKRLKTYEIVKKESKWQSYVGSNSFLKDELKEEIVTVEKKEIIKVAFTNKQLTYLETQALFCYGVIESDEYYNDNILGKFYRKDLLNDEEDIS